MLTEHLAQTQLPHYRTSHVPSKHTRALLLCARNQPREPLLHVAQSTTHSCGGRGLRMGQRSSTQTQTVEDDEMGNGGIKASRCNLNIQEPTCNSCFCGYQEITLSQNYHMEHSITYLPLPQHTHTNVLRSCSTSLSPHSIRFALPSHKAQCLKKKSHTRL